MAFCFLMVSDNDSPSAPFRVGAAWRTVSCFWFLVSGCGLSKSKSKSGSGSKSEAYHPGFRFLVSGFRTLQISGRFVNFRFRCRYGYRFRSPSPPVKPSAGLHPIRGQECPRSVLFIRGWAKPCSFVPQSRDFGAHVRGTWSFQTGSSYAHPAARGVNANNYNPGPSVRKSFT